LLLLPLLVCGWRAARQKKTISAAICLALASSLKPFIGLFLFYFLMRKEWQGLCAFLLTLFSCALIAALFLGFDSYVAYYHVCQQIKWAASSWNVSIYGFLLRLVGGIESNVALLPVPGLITYLYPLLAGIFFLAIIQFLRPALDIPTQRKIDLDFSVIITAMLLLSPLGWLYYFPLLSIPILILWQWAKTGIYPIALPVMLMTCIFFSNIPISLLSSEQIHTANVLHVFFGSSLCFLVLIGLTNLLFWLRYRLAGNTDKNSSAKSIHFEKIPPGLLLLIGIVVFLPSYHGIGKGTVDWLLHSTHYSQQYSLVAHHQE
jgi:hypothetical protein